MKIITPEEFDKVIQRKKVRSMYRRLTETEMQWSQEAIKKCMINGRVSASEIKNQKICDDFKKKFGRTISVSGLYNRFYKMSPGYRRRGTNPAEISNYLVYVKVSGQIAGFETEDEIKTFIETNQVVGNNNIRIFKHVPVSVEYKVKIGE